MSDKIGPAEGELITFLRKRDYLMVRELGAGACGRTVLLHDDQIDEHFVCKKYNPYSESMRASLYANFAREVKLLHRVHHQNVVRVFNYFLYPEQFTGYILMEFVDGENVDDYVAAYPDRVTDVFVQTLNEFTHLEQSGILHRDIRPGNLMVTKEGVVKIIDLGFGKQVSRSTDFDKSITLNWWCDTPEEFASSRYDFGTEVYFIGKLFEKLIAENDIRHFDYADLLRRMCAYDPNSRIRSFSAVIQELRNNQFTEVDFCDTELYAYRQFADELCAHITKIESGAKYFDDIDTLHRQLRDVYRSFMLEETAPDAAVVTRCFVFGSYYYRQKGFSVKAVRGFLDLLSGCTNERLQILAANLRTRLDSITRYAGGPPNDDIPF